MTRVETLAIFDFDKTLVAKDSFRLFTNLCARGPLDVAALYGYAVSAKLRMITNTRYKELALERVWHPLGAKERAARLNEMLSLLREHLVDAVVAEIRSHLDMQNRVLVLSASPELYVEPLVREISPDIEVHGSAIHELPETIDVENLYGDEKAALARDLIGRIPHDDVHFYTDHRHDLGVMKLVDRVTLVGPDRATVAAVEAAGVTFEVLMP